MTPLHDPSAPQFPLGWDGDELLFGDVEGDTDRFDALVEAGASQAQLLLIHRSLCATSAVPRCLAEAERALAEGRSRRARFWTERAAVLRQRT